MRSRFLPRYRALAWSSIGLGGALSGVAVGVMAGALLPLATGAIGVVLGAGYLLSPSWRLEVVADDRGIRVRAPAGVKFELAWADVVKVTSSPTTNTCFVDGGAPEKSLLVPGVGAPAPYDLSDKPALCAEILAHVPADRVETVATLEAARAAKSAKAAKVQPPADPPGDPPKDPPKDSV